MDEGGAARAATITELFDAAIAGDFRGVLEILNEVIKEATYMPTAALAVGFDLLTTGITTFLDDFQDFGRFDRIHHWHIGIILILAAIVVICFACIKFLELL